MYQRRDRTVKLSNPCTFFKIQVSSSLIKSNALELTKEALITSDTGSITLKPNKDSTVSVFIPSKSTVRAVSDWDGRINPPLIQSMPRVSVTGDAIEGSTRKLLRGNVLVVLKVGSDKARLDFSNKVTLTIPVKGRADGEKVAIYSSQTGHVWMSEGEGTVKDGKVVFETFHLTYFFALEGKKGVSVETLHGAAPANVAKRSIQFTDTVGHWAEAFIRNIANLGIVKGKTVTRFAPDDLITRAELTKLAVAAFAVPIPMPETITYKPFDDVELDEWYAPFVVAARMKGLVSNVGKPFNPNAPITRAEALKILMVAAGYSDIDYNFQQNYAGNSGWTYAGFRDVPMGAWFAKFVAYAKDFGIVGGNDDGLFHPENPMTRAEVSKVVVRMLDRK